MHKVKYKILKIKSINLRTLVSNMLTAKTMVVQLFPKHEFFFISGDRRYRCLCAPCWTSSLLMLFSQVLMKIVEGKRFPAMNSPVYGEGDGADFVS